MTFATKSSANTIVQRSRLRSTSEPPPNGPAPVPTPNAPERPESFPECMSTRKMSRTDRKTWTTLRISSIAGRMVLGCGPMSRRLALVCLVAVAAAALAAAPAAPAVVIRSSCSAAGSKTVLRTRLVRVYYTRAKRPIGCLKRSGRRVPLDHAVDPFYAPGDAHLGRLRLAGDVLAYTWIDPGLPAVYVHSVSLRNGRALHRTRIDPYTIPEPSALAVTALVVRSTGGMAWI